MAETNNQYRKFMSDIIDSGLWGRLSPAAKTLYPVLLKFSDQNFKQVWPSNETLLKLTGFKTKKSISLAKKELIKEGLLQYRAGSGRTNSTYFFSFNYEGSKITPLWDKKIPLSEPTKYPADHSSFPPQRTTEVPPNNLNITINNTQSTNEDLKHNSFEKLIEIYGFNIVDTATQIAKSKDLDNNVSYIAGICKNLSKDSKVFNRPTFNQAIDPAQHVIDSWKNFLDWSKTHLTRSSVEMLQKIAIGVDGQAIFIEEKLSQFLKQIILKYFNEEVSPSIIIIFSDQNLVDSRINISHKYD